MPGAQPVLWQDGLMWLGGTDPPGNLQVLTGTVLLCSVLYVASSSLGSKDATGRADWHSRVVSTVHACFACAAACYLVVADTLTAEGLVSAEAAAFRSSVIRDRLLMVTAGYLVYDLLLCLWHWKELGDALTITHHVVVVAAFVLGVTHEFGTWYMAALLVSEASTPFVNLRAWLLASSMENSRWYTANGVALFIVFFVCRILLGISFLVHIAWAWYELVEDHWDRRTPTELAVLFGLTALFAAHAALNFFWFHRIWGHVKRRLGLSPLKPAGDKGNSVVGSSSVQSDGSSVRRRARGS